MSTTTATAIDTVFDTLLAEIVRGTYTAGTRLPAERELSKRLGASRPTLREALRRLGEWKLVEPRRGSGVIVRSWREWSIEVLPAYLRYAQPNADQPKTATLLLDLLQLRRSVVIEMTRHVVKRLPVGQTRAARAACARAWAVRHDVVQFVRADVEAMRCVTEMAGFVPGIWLLNRLAEIYVEIGIIVQAALLPPEDYLEVQYRFFDALDRADPEAATEIMSEWHNRMDQQVIGMLEALV